jgi:hypothetical protein
MSIVHPFFLRLYSPKAPMKSTFGFVVQLQFLLHLDCHYRGNDNNVVNP